MDWQAWLTLAVTLGAVLGMALNLAPPDVMLVAGMTLLLVAGVLTTGEATVGFSNEGMLTVAVLFAMAAGIRETGALDLVGRRLLGRPKSVPAAQLRLMAPVAFLSAWINNTPVVAVMLPVVQDWARRSGLPVSKLLIPLSWATILGGTTTLIGTSTNLVVSGLAQKRGVEVGLFDITPVGVVVALAGIAYVVLCSRLLPDRRDGTGVLEGAREYSLSMRVRSDSPIVGESLEAAGLRHLPGLYLIEIERRGQVLTAVEPTIRIEAEDELVFVGVVESVVDLRKIKGLVAATDQVAKLAQPRLERVLVEAVVAVGSPLVGRSIRESEFRTQYGAAVIAVHRRGERVAGKVGDIVLQPGDTLLLEARAGFVRQHRSDPSFALVAEVEGSVAPRHERAWIAMAAMAGMIVAHTVFGVALLTAALVATGVMVLLRCVSASEALRSVEIRVLLAIASSFAIGSALEKTGAAGVLGHGVVGFAESFGPVGILAAVYLATAVLTELITNNAAAALMFPIAAATAQDAGMDLRPFLFILMMAASASFSTPIGYQTNLMVMGPGGYRFSDFLRFGIPLQLVLAVVSVAMVSWLWL
jgi:di/tricarboxylate transporter